MGAAAVVLETPTLGASIHVRLRQLPEITTDFWEETNGLRFPGQVTIVRNRYRVTGNAARPYETSPQVEVTQTYIGYDFRTIPTEEEIRRLIFGTGH